MFGMSVDVESSPRGCSGDDIIEEPQLLIPRKRYLDPGWLVVVGGFLLQLTFGSLNCGNLSVYISSYMRAKLDHNYRYAEATWIHSETVMVQSVVMPLGGYFVTRMGPMRVAFLGCSIAIVGVLLTGVSIMLSPALLVFTYGVIYGVGAGIAFVVPLVCSLKWYPDEPGFVTGTILAGYTFGSVLFAYIELWAINPGGIKMDMDSGYFEHADLLDRIPMAFLIFGGSYAIIQLTACSLMKDPPAASWKSGVKGGSFFADLTQSYPTTQAGSGSSPKPITHLFKASQRTTYGSYDKRSSGNALLLDVPDLEDDLDLSPREAIQTDAFFKMWITSFLIMQVMVCSHTMDELIDLNKATSEGFRAIIAPITCTLNSVSSMVWGALSDRYSFRTAMMASSGILTVFFLSYIIVDHFQSGVMYTIWRFVVFSSSRSCASVLPGAVYRTFGPRYFGVNYGLVETSSAMGQAIQSLMVEQIYLYFGPVGVAVATAICTAGAWIVAYTVDAETSPANIRSRYSSEAHPSS